MKEFQFSFLHDPVSIFNKQYSHFKRVGVSLQYTKMCILSINAEGSCHRVFNFVNVSRGPHGSPLLEQNRSYRPWIHFGRASTPIS